MRVLVVVNEKAGQGDAGLGGFVLALASRGIDLTLRYMTEERPLEVLLSDAAEFDRIVVAGGDGTVSSACYTLRNVDVPLMPYPAGTGNLLAQNLKMPNEPAGLVNVLMEGAELTVDVGEIEFGPPNEQQTRGFSIIAGAGYAASLMEAATALKPSMGPAAYVVAGVSQVAPRHALFQLRLDGELVETDGIAVLLMNFGRLFFDLPVSLSADPSDGLFDVVVIRTRTVVELAPALLGSFLDLMGQRQSSLPGLDVFKAADVEVSAYPPMPLQYDGEVPGALTPFHARILPCRTRLVVPSSTVAPTHEPTEGDSEGYSAE